MTSHLHRALFFVTTGDYASANTDDQRQIVTSIVYLAAKPNVAIGQRTPRHSQLRCRSLAIRDAQVPLTYSPNGNTPWSLVIRNRTADSMVWNLECAGSTPNTILR